MDGTPFSRKKDRQRNGAKCLYAWKYPWKEQKSLSISLPLHDSSIHAHARAYIVEPFFRKQRQKLTVHSAASRRLFDYYIRRWVNASRKSHNSLRNAIYGNGVRYTRPRHAVQGKCSCINHGSVNHTVYGIQWEIPIQFIFPSVQA